MREHGPWALHDMEFATVVTVEKPGRFIALCEGRSFSAEENLEHALLIVAAPNLLKALNMAIPFLKIAQREADHEIEPLTVAKAAIAKVTGD